MVAPPVPPVKAPSSKSCSSLTKPFPFRSFGKSNATSILLDFAADRANSFTLISLTDPHSLNPVVSILYKNTGGRDGQSFLTRNHQDLLFRSPHLTIGSDSPPARSRHARSLHRLRRPHSRRPGL